MIIIVIDNLGLISTDTFYKGTEKDDYLAGKLKELSELTDSSIFLIHHITKENSRAFNLKEGYRPRKEYIKGSSRILDYVQQAMMINLPRKYKDLASEEKDKAIMFATKERSGSFDKTRFLMEFWTINPQGDVIYGLTYPDGHFFIYSISANKFTDLGEIDPNKVYHGPERQWRTLSRALICDESGKVYMSGDKGMLIYYDPETEDIREG